MRWGVAGTAKHTARCRRSTARRTCYRIDSALGWYEDVDKGGNSQYGAARLGMVDEVSLARLVFRVPFEYVKLRVVGSLARWLYMPCMSGIGSRMKLFMSITV